ncbi:MAG: hypothetical protein SCALA702_16180 [Melioribacteraceae bacterium]|nr:MAG: hypothetical protein SCALA702_16180 [Melioribacteraceae bacterium]
MKKFLLKISVLLFGSFLALLLIPELYEYAQSDLARFKTLRDDIEKREMISGGLLFFGNSVVMCGVNGNLIDDSLNTAKSKYSYALNYSSPGQNILESIIFADEVESQNSIYLFGFTVNDLFDDSLVIASSKKLALYNYGFEPDSVSLSTISELYDPELSEVYSSSFLLNSYKSRSIVLETLNSFLRNTIRGGGLNINKAYTDIKHPQPYTERVPNKKLVLLLDKKYGNINRNEPELPSKTVNIMRFISEKYSIEGNIVIFIVLPDHPYLQEISPQGFYKNLGAQLSEISELTGSIILNYSRFFDSELMFVDHTHSTPEAADSLSKQIFSDLLRGVKN